MRLLLHLFALSGILSLTFANNHSRHRHLLSRQTADCLPIFLQYPSDSDVQCGGGSTYVMPGCACCPGGTLGCYTATDVCSADAVGNDICCPQNEPGCGEVNISPTTTAPPSSSTTAYEYPGSAASSTQADPGSTPAATQNNPGSAATTSAVATVQQNGASTFMLVELKSLVMIILLGLV